jgi:hypothetical protein
MNNNLFTPEFILFLISAKLIYFYSLINFIISNNYFKNYYSNLFNFDYLKSFMLNYIFFFNNGVYT